MALPSIFRTFAPPTVFFPLAELVASAPTAVVTGPKRLTTLYLANTDTVERTINIQNAAGVYLAKNMVLAPETPAPQFDRVFMYVNGLTITASGAGVVCQTEGYAHAT